MGQKGTGSELFRSIQRRGLSLGGEGGGFDCLAILLATSGATAKSGNESSPISGFNFAKMS